MNKEAISGVMYGITVAKGIIGVAMDELEDCGLDESDQDMVKESMLTCLQELSMAFDKVDFAKDERVKS